MTESATENPITSLPGVGEVLASDAEDVSEIEDFQINPYYYAHIAIKQILKGPQMAFMNGQTQAALLSLIVAVDQLEQIARATFDFVKKKKEKLPDGTEKEMSLEERYKEAYGQIRDDSSNDTIKECRKANAKLAFLFKLFFDRREKPSIVRY